MTLDSEIIACIRDSLSAITAPRFYQTERGFQGELLVQLSRRLPLLDQEIVEQEHQKRLRDHGLTIRPDIIIHEPFDPARHAARTEGNRAVMELKLNATRAEAAEDLESLAVMIQVLRYPLGVFVNIASSVTYADLVPRAARGRVVAFAVTLKDGKPSLIEERA
jgi:hypothetical protein